MRVKVNYSNLPKGAEVAVHGLGILQNGEEVTLKAEDLDLFKATYNLDKLPSSMTFSDDHNPSFVTESDEPVAQPVVEVKDKPADAADDAADTEGGDK